MQIYLKKRGATFTPPENAKYPLIVLQWDSWNDFSYMTLFVSSIRHSSNPLDTTNLGYVKIQRLGQQKNEFTFSRELVGPFSLMDFNSTICSLGVSEEYYKCVQTLQDDALIDKYFRSMNDVALNSQLRTTFQDDDCFKISLLREWDSRRLLDDAAKMFGQESSLVNDFSAIVRLPNASTAHTFDFKFSEFNGLPHRLHALVGLNGVGKTQVMARLAMLMSRFSKKSERDKTSIFETEGTLSPVPSIHNVVAISFSAFDEFERPTVLQGERFRYSYCGLRTQRGRLLSEDDLLENIRRIVTEELDATKRTILADALVKLIKVDNIHSFVNNPDEHRNLYDRLSAGQRIALNAICHTLAKLEPRTLVLFDEPELHLHPQLLTTMLTALLELLAQYDSFAIVATHSPLVIQQIPSRCTHIIKRDRMMPIVFQPRLEFFGETLTEITRNVFLTTETDRDYRDTLDKLLHQNNHNVDRVEALFDGNLSLNARVYLESRRKALSEE